MAIYAYAIGMGAMPHLLLEQSFRHVRFYGANEGVTQLMKRALDAMLSAVAVPQPLKVVSVGDVAGLIREQPRRDDEVVSEELALILQYVSGSGRQGDVASSILGLALVYLASGGNGAAHTYDVGAFSVLCAQSCQFASAQSCNDYEAPGVYVKRLLDPVMAHVGVVAEKGVDISWLEHMTYTHSRLLGNLYLAIEGRVDLKAVFPAPLAEGRNQAAKVSAGLF